MKDRFLLDARDINAHALAVLDDVVANLKRRARIAVYGGAETMPLRLMDAAVFYTDRKLVFAVDLKENKYICHKTIRQLEAELDPRQFFRANRQTIVNIDAIASFKAYKTVKLQLKLHLPHICHTVIISQQTAPKFKKWISEL